MRATGLSTLFVVGWAAAVLAGGSTGAGPLAAYDTVLAKVELGSGGRSRSAAVARSRLEAVDGFLRDNPDNKAGGVMSELCSLLVEVASVQRSVLDLRGEVARMRDSIVTVLFGLNEVHLAILDFERGRASELKASLDAERRRAEELRADADKRFNELQSELINVRQDARGTIISMSDILFDIGKAGLTSDLKTNLAKIAGILTIFKDSRVIVEGHTDNQGSAEYNQKLAEERAGNVRDFLIAQGIVAGRLSSVGYGFTRPVADNETREGRQKNRRVDLVVQETRSAPPVEAGQP